MSSKNGWSRRTLPITDVKLVIMVDAELDQLLDVVGRKLRLTKSSLARMAICRLTEDALTRELSREDADEPLLKRFFKETLPTAPRQKETPEPKGGCEEEVLDTAEREPKPAKLSKKHLLLALRGATKQEDIDEILELLEDAE